MLRNRKNAQAVAAFWNKSLDQRDWYAVDIRGDTAEIRIYDIIGWPFVEADKFLSDLNAITQEKILVRINSPGGDVFDGTAIYNALREFPAQITTRVDGLAASMASIIALAGKKREIAKSAHYMIHNPWTFAVGDEKALEKSVELLKKIGGSMASIYADASGKKEQEIKQMMADETWMTGSEAIANGFMQSLSGESAKAALQFDLSMFEHAPKGIGSGIDIKDLEQRLTRDAGLSRSQARSLLQSGFKGLSMPGAGQPEEIEALDKLISHLRS